MSIYSSFAYTVNSFFLFSFSFKRKKDNITCISYTLSMKNSPFPSSCIYLLSCLYSFVGISDGCLHLHRSETKEENYYGLRIKDLLLLGYLLPSF
jgi:hypothetical protein